jgi:hypothetical protein
MYLSPQMTLTLRRFSRSIVFARVGGNQPRGMRWGLHVQRSFAHKLPQRRPCRFRFLIVLAALKECA